MSNKGLLLSTLILAFVIGLSSYKINSSLEKISSANPSVLGAQTLTIAGKKEQPKNKAVIIKGCIGILKNLANPPKPDGKTKPQEMGGIQLKPKPDQAKQKIELIHSCIDILLEAVNKLESSPPVGKPSCTPRPACTYVNPRCLLVEDPNWCPPPTSSTTLPPASNPKLTCTPRPACTYTNPRCLLKEDPNWCPPPSRTTDKSGETRCPKILWECPAGLTAVPIEGTCNYKCVKQ